MNNNNNIEENEPYTLYDLLYKIDAKRINRCEALDVLIPSVLNNASDVSRIAHHLRYTALTDMMPLTKQKINKIIRGHLQAERNEDYYGISNYDIASIENWLNAETLNYLARKYLTGFIQNYTIKNLDLLEREVKVQLFNRSIERYKEYRSGYKLSEVERIFKHIEPEDIKLCADKLVEGTTALNACLLVREDLNEGYILKGLKALSKLSRQRNPVKIDFSMLKNLGPKSRLEAIKQLLGLNISWRSKEENPFIQQPSVEELSEFLFPCSLKYNDQVVKCVEKYKSLVEKQESDNSQ